MDQLTILDEKTAGRDVLHRARLEILQPSFPPELYVDQVDSGHDGPLLIAVAGNSVIGVALGEIFSGSDALLGYLAVRPGHRGQGVGNVLMRAIHERWITDGRRWFVEVDDPRHYVTHEGYGDPEARLRFYHRFGVLGIPIPYFQPRLRDDLSRGVHMILGLVPPPGTQPATVLGPAVREFLTLYFAGCEGPGALDDVDVAWLLDWCPDGDLPLVPLVDLEQLPDDEPPSAGPGQA